MLKVFISRKFEIEKKYTIEALFKHILGIEYAVEYHNSDNYTIETPNGNSIVIVDQYFYKLDDQKSLLTQSKLPSDINFINSNLAIDEKIPTLFGKPQISASESGNVKKIKLQADIFSSSFFMLTRMEEYLINDRDEHERFQGDNSLACKHDFLHRPVVNEYAELLWNILLSLGYDEKNRGKSEYKIFPTHDVDKIYFKLNSQNILGDLFLDWSLSRAIKRARLPKKNYWDTFSWLMDESEKNNLKSTFYFIPDSQHKLDNRYSLNEKLVKEKIGEIKSRGHLIGIHPGYATMKNEIEFLKQKRILEEAVGFEITLSRQHYLRFDIHHTGRILEKANIQIDSSLGFADKVGFRCGTSSKFPIFDLYERRKLNVMESPLIIMETILRDRKKPEESARKSVKVFEYYKSVCKKYHIPLTILFHNNSFDPIRWDGWKEVYENILRR